MKNCYCKRQRQFDLFESCLANITDFILSFAGFETNCIHMCVLREERKRTSFCKTSSLFSRQNDRFFLLGACSLKLDCREEQSSLIERNLPSQFTNPPIERAKSEQTPLRIFIELPEKNVIYVRPNKERSERGETCWNERNFSVRETKTQNVTLLQVWNR